MELKKDYELVVLDYNLNNRFEELEKITDLKSALLNCPATKIQSVWRRDMMQFAFL